MGFYNILEKNVSGRSSVDSVNLDKMMRESNSEQSTVQSTDSTGNKIRDLFFGSQLQDFEQKFRQIDKELQALNQLREHLLDSQRRTEDTAEILVDSLKLAARDREKLIGALSDPVDGCIQNIVEQKPQVLADSLFPVMGPAIRKSISEALKSLVQSINQMVEQSMSLKSLSWRWEAARSGVPFSEIVLKHSLVYRVEEVFLIQQGTGLLIEHVSHPEVVERDSDAISAMLTVIRDFTRDSFATESSESLQTVEFGEHTLWIFDGPKAILACVNRGLVPENNRTDLQAVLERFHSQYGRQLEQFSGDRSHHPEFQTLLKTCLTQRSRDPGVTERKRETRHWLSKPVTWIVLLLLSFGGYRAWIEYDESGRINALLSELKSIPGVVVIDSEKKDGKLVVKGLRDPLAPSPDLLASKYGFSLNDLQFEMALYQSLDPPLAVQRAARFLDAPDTVALTANGEELLLAGTASRQWLDSVIDMNDRIPGFKHINTERVIVDEASKLDLIRQQLQAPETVQMRLDKDQLFVTGIAPSAWISTLERRASEIQPELSLEITDHGKQLLSKEWQQAMALIKSLNEVSFYFNEGTVENADQQTMLQEQMNKVRQLLMLQKDLKGNLEFVVTGYVDGVGSGSRNQALKLKRAGYIKKHLIKSGVNPEAVSVIAGNRAISNNRTDPLLRRADLKIIVNRKRSQGL